MPIGRGGSGTPFPSDGARSGSYIYDDQTYDATPLVIPGTSTYVKITNDAAGPLTGSFPVEGVTDLWNEITGQFDLTELRIGDSVEVRLDLTAATTSPNQLVNIAWFGGIGSPQPFALSFIDTSYRDTGPHNINRYTPVFAIDENTTNFPSELRIQSDSTLNVTQIRFFLNIITRGSF